jgi:hypothetical protein
MVGARLGSCWARLGTEGREGEGAEGEGGAARVVGKRGVGASLEEEARGGEVVVEGCEVEGCSPLGGGERASA